MLLFISLNRAKSKNGTTFADIWEEVSLDDVPVMMPNLHVAGQERTIEAATVNQRLMAVR
jgi:hypothetical protein